MIIELTFIKLAIAYLLGITMPGPSTALIIKAAVVDSRAAAITSSLGIMLGIALQSGILLIGTVYIHSESPLFKILTILCSCYLTYLGLKTLLNKTRKRNFKEQQDKGSSISSHKTCSSYFMEGFLLEILNPIAFTFFLSILTLIIDPSSAWYIKSLYWLEIMVLGLLWFSAIAVVASHPRVVSHMRQFNSTVEWVAGGIFVSFGALMCIKSITFY